MDGWIRIHRENLNRRDLFELTDRQFRAWVNCQLCADKDGKLPRLDHLCWNLRMPLADTAALVDELVAAGLFAKQGDVFSIVDWEKSQRDGRPLAAEWRIIRERIFERDDYTCTYCGARGVKLHCDHVHPVAHGGEHGDDNLVTACEPCNRAKRSKLVSVEEWRAIRGGQS